MQTESALLFNRSDVQELLSLAECIDAVEKVFHRQGEGKIPPSGILGVRTQTGGLHVKTACLSGAKKYIVAKLNTNFPQNYRRFRKPTIQGVIVLYDADNGRLLAVLDSMEITIRRTAAATGVAAKYLARQNSSVATICGCGEQARAQLRALCLILSLRKVYAFDIDSSVSLRLAAQLSRELPVDIEAIRSLRGAIGSSDVVVTCTPATEFFVHKEDVAPGTFIAAVGADDSHKQEIDPALLASAKVVADSFQQVCSIGETHHAIARGLMRKEDVYAELSEVVAGKKAGRINETDIIVFDSTGVAVEDAAAATVVYEKALITGIGNYFEFAA
ncbi:MAG TPA: ornithine cyclodeaminase family protein [Candidatus Tectomicrobia bacterium]|nr:ornithine cyclodeaminase family protein [Candidatus Tectomicrobia bacterium]